MIKGLKLRLKGSWSRVTMKTLWELSNKENNNNNIIKKKRNKPIF